MKIAVNCILTLFLMNSCAQTTLQAGHIKTGQFEGYAFDKGSALFASQFPDLKERYTPSEKDIIASEKAINEQLAGINQQLLNQSGSCPVIHKNLKKYKRQYVGYINNKGEKVIWINFIWAKDASSLEALSKDVIRVLDGCSYYWNVKVNITQEKLYDLYINGSA